MPQSVYELLLPKLLASIYDYLDFLVFHVQYPHHFWLPFSHASHMLVPIPPDPRTLQALCTQGFSFVIIRFCKCVLPFCSSLLFSVVSSIVQAVKTGLLEILPVALRPNLLPSHLINLIKPTFSLTGSEIFSSSLVFPLSWLLPKLVTYYLTQPLFLTYPLYPEVLFCSSPETHLPFWNHISHSAWWDMFVSFGNLMWAFFFFFHSFKKLPLIVTLPYLHHCWRVSRAE